MSDDLIILASLILIVIALAYALTEARRMDVHMKERLREEVEFQRERAERDANPIDMG